MGISESYAFTHDVNYHVDSNIEWVTFDFNHDAVAQMHYFQNYKKFRNWLHKKGILYLQSHCNIEISNAKRQIINNGINYEISLNFCNNWRPQAIVQFFVPTQSEFSTKFGSADFYLIWNTKKSAWWIS